MDSRPLISLADAKDALRGLFSPLPAVERALGECSGLVTTEAVVASEPVPPFANSAMDGYALRAAETAALPARLAVVGTLPAGSTSGPAVGAGQAARIMTGAPMPPGADSVAMLEVTRDLEDGRVEVLTSVRPGENVRMAGEDVGAGDTVFEAGTELSPAHLGVLASLGIETVRVHRRPKVGVLSSGDELVAGRSHPLRPGAIRDANRPALLALVEEAGCEPVDLGIVPDDEASLRRAMSEGAELCDALLTSAGVSLGDFDHVRRVLLELSGGTMTWLEVAVKPAKPLAFGAVGSTPVVGLPGNPVAALVSFELFARPGLRTMLGSRHPERSRVTAVAGHDMPRRPDGKLHLVRVVLSPGDSAGLVARSSGGQGSHQLAAMARANALALLPDGPGARAGEDLEVMLLRPW